ncbi:PAS domain S-box-containing protein [Natrinema hispanicum]|uniref:histidine kinase n=2 Tax=Natrinema hispanicum TaxID=392421 RepID=A0A482Y6P3_9EURY|nr:PAS domain S-box-containing protein [Natrinema hispanicum]
MVKYDLIMETKNPSLPSIVDRLNAGVTLHEPETGVILDVNNRLEQLYGYSAGELRGMSVGDITPSSQRYTEADALDRIQAAAAGNSQIFEWKIERANGESRWVRVHLTPTQLDGEVYVCAEVNDITKYKAREQLLRLLNRVIRHNLRNEMNILMGYTDRVKAAIENDQLEEELETVLEIASEVGRLSDSLTEIEQIVESEATQREATNLRTLVQTCATAVQSTYPAVDLLVEAPADVWVVGNTGLKHAIEHAIDNAVRHNDQETPEVTILVTDDPEANQGIVRIADNGPSIPEIETDVLDDETEISSTYHGSGVGLWVMQWAVNSLGGDLSFEENSPRGNLVQIALPKAE